MLVVDAANVVGSRPDGWWRDRAGAAGRLIERIDAALESGRLEGPIVVVLEGRARAAAATADPHPQRRVVAAGGSGDDTIVAVVGKAAGDGKRVTLVTADRGLGARARRLGAEVVGPTTLWNDLEAGAPG